MTLNTGNDILKIVSYSTKNPDRRAEVLQGVERITAGRPFDVRFVDDDLAAIEALRDAEIYNGWHFTEEMLRTSPRLRWIHVPGAGVDGFLNPAFCKSDILLTNSSGVHGLYITEWILSALFYISQKLAEAEAWRHDRNWRPHKDAMTRQRFFVMDGMRALIVGYGHIGQVVAEKFMGLGIECEAVANTIRPSLLKLHGTAALPDILKDFDIVVIALPLTAKTRGLFNRDLLQSMRPGSILVNIARGKIIEESALIDALQNGPLGYAALDVFAVEPLPADSPLFELRNLFMTPHISGNFPAYTRRVNEMFLQNLECYVSGQPLSNVIDKRRGY
jgi:phosphoglycerate dehydrogenase-like enzyme